MLRNRADCVDFVRLTVFERHGDHVRQLERNSRVTTKVEWRSWCGEHERLGVALTDFELADLRLAPGSDRRQHVPSWRQKGAGVNAPLAVIGERDWIPSGLRPRDNIRDDDRPF